MNGIKMANIEGIEPTDTDHWFRLVVFQQEIERIRFILRSYLRTRQEKIEKFALHLTRDELARSKLSPLEVDYSNRYFAIVETYLRNTASLESLLPRYQRLDEEGDVTMVTKPDLDEAVFCRVKEPLGDFQPENGGQAFEMNMGDIYIIRYSWIRKLLSEQKVQLL
ncbi:hypothetical protein BJ742DRAFT_2360 [Cladochytrium replicatum]|nr:hypothetical protein BJ742DRAFT_2360 [Cladochytrium replicatum]